MLHYMSDGNGASGISASNKVSPWAKLLFILGIVIFLANMTIAWALTIRANTLISQPLVSDGGGDQTVVKALSLLPKADANTHIFAQQLIGLDATLRTISNRHILMVIAMASAFSLIAVGFSLFVMGIESAFTISSGKENTGTVAMKATAPGLACFLFATLIVVTSVMRQTDIHTANIAAFESDGSAANLSPAGVSTTRAVELKERTAEEVKAEQDRMDNTELKAK